MFRESRLAAGVQAIRLVAAMIFADFSRKFLYLQILPFAIVEFIKSDLDF